MIYSRGLLLKGLLGFGAVTAASYGGLSQKERIAGWFSSGDEPVKPAEITGAANENDLPGKVGLNCPTATAAGVDCSKAAEGNIKVKQEQNKFEVSTIPANSKIKLYKLTGENDYNQGLKFVIEGGDIAGTEEASGKKLEEFETYEIKEEADASNPNTKKYYLSRKTEAKAGIKKALGIPDACELPTSTPCSVDSTKINNINFDGKQGTITGSGSLQITVVSSSEKDDFPLGYKFTLTPNGGNITINRSGNAGNITLESGKPKEFKIKQDAQNKKLLTLEEAWSLTNLPGKVNLTCTVSSGTLSETNGADCTKTGNTDIKAKKNTTDLSVSSISGGKIKVYKTSAGEDHNEGFKFVIEGGDISATSGGNNKLEQFETYEIKKDSSEWKLVKKTDAKDGIKKALGLDQIEGCDLPKPEGCDVAGEKFKKIKFDGGNEGGENGPTEAKLKITTEEDKATFPFGYKFVLDSTSEAKISSSLTIKGNTNTEFKIKKTEGTNTITLEKALDAAALGKKINLTCTTTGTKECSLNNGNTINVKDGTNSRKGVSFQNGDSGKKLTYTEDQQDYNQGIKFSTSEEICLENGNPNTGNPTSIANSGEGYEIKKEGDDWFLVKKAAAR